MVLPMSDGADSRPTFYEFFAGGGMARAGLGDSWRCVFANDFDPKKVEAYKANWGDGEIVCEDIYRLNPEQLPGTADLAWASFPCQDLSLAGNGKGLAGERSGTFNGFCNLMHRLAAQGRAPRTIILENVVGVLTSSGGEDFVEICRAINALGYAFGAMIVDAVRFVPQSRPRFFMLAVRKDIAHRHLAADAPTTWTTPKSLSVAFENLRPDLKANWRWWRLPEPPARNASLIDIVESEPSGVKWHTPDETARLVGLMSEVNAEKLRAAQAQGKRVVGTIYRRTRPDENGVKRQRAELRMDGVAGCLRTPGGGSSRQFLLEIEGKKTRSRLISSREAARLMGWPEDKAIPQNYNEAYHLFGDGLAVPVVGWLGRVVYTVANSDSRLIAAE